MSRLRTQAEKKKVIKPSVDDQILKPSSKLSKRDIDSSSHRLSKTTKRYTSLDQTKSNKKTSFSEDYYQSHPEASVDLREPIEKIEDLDKQITSLDSDSQDLINLLVQKKAAVYLAFGESSRESILAHYDIGVCYDNMGRPQSGVRHLSKARQLEQTTEITSEESFMLSLEYASCHYDLHEQKSSGKDKAKQSEAVKHLNEADSVLKQIYGFKLDNQELMYRKSLLMARVSMKKKRFAEAAKQFDEAIQLYSGKQDKEFASLQVEAGNAYAHSEQDAVPYYQKAYEIYVSLSMKEEAAAIEPFLTHDSESDDVATVEPKQVQKKKIEEDSESYASYEEDSDDKSV